MPTSWVGRSSGVPSNNSLPRLGRNNAPISLSRVDLPQPEGPTRVMNSFCSIESVTFSSAMTRPLREAYVLCRPSIWILLIGYEPRRVEVVRRHRMFQGIGAGDDVERLLHA